MPKLIVHFDGGSRGNPGPAGIGVVVSADDGTELVTLGRYIGAATNNVAEYKAMITGLEKARELNATDVIVRGDSELVIKQMKGQYRVKNPGLKPLWEQAMGLARGFSTVAYEHGMRETNKTADKLVNLALDRRADVTEI